MWFYIAFYSIIAILALSTSFGRRSDGHGGILKFILFMVVIVVGLRFETAFDWPLYKGQFELYMSRGSGGVISSFIDASQSYRHEYGFLAVVTLAAQFLPSYEIFQFIVFIFFLYALITLYGHMPESEKVFAVFFVLSLVMFSLVMSTIRQSIAISFFMLGMNSFFNGNKRSGIMFFFGAPFFHISSLLYIFVFFLGSLSFGKSWIRTVVYSVVICAMVVFFSRLYVGFGFYGSDKLSYYMERSWGSNLAEKAYFITFNLLILFYSAYCLASKDSSEGEKYLCRMLVILSGMALAFVELKTLRNRVFYDTVIIFSLYTGFIVYRRKLVLVVASILCFINIAGSLYKDSSVAYVPYQNYLLVLLTGDEGTGVARQIEVRELLIRNLGK